MMHSFRRATIIPLWETCVGILKIVSYCVEKVNFYYLDLFVIFLEENSHLSLHFGPAKTDIFLIVSHFTKK